MIETHSEHLLLRIMKRMRHTAEGRIDKDDVLSLTPDDVCLLYVDNNGGNTFINELELDTDGTLLDIWPNGFFEEGWPVEASILQHKCAALDAVLDPLLRLRDPLLSDLLPKLAELSARLKASYQQLDPSPSDTQKVVPTPPAADSNASLHAQSNPQVYT